MKEKLSKYKNNILITTVLICKDFNVTMRQYNQLSSSMIAFENSYLNMWKNSIDEAKHGLKGYLLKKSEMGYNFRVNSDEKLDNFVFYKK